MNRMIRSALGIVLALGGAVASVSATAQDPQPKPSSQPAAKASSPAPPTTQPKPTPSGETSPKPPPSGETSGAAEGKPKDDASVRTPRSLSAEEVLKAFQMDRPTRVPLAPSGGSDETPAQGVTGAPPTRSRLPDGFFLVDRVGRVVKEGDWYVFVFEGYNESHPEPPMKLLPNQLLERMVLESGGAINSPVFIVSGEVTEFEGENYLLLRKLWRRRNLGNLEK